MFFHLVIFEDIAFDQIALSELKAYIVRELIWKGVDCVDDVMDKAGGWIVARPVEWDVRASELIENFNELEVVHAFFLNVCGWLRPFLAGYIKDVSVDFFTSRHVVEGCAAIAIQCDS